MIIGRIKLVLKTVCNLVRVHLATQIHLNKLYRVGGHYIRGTAGTHPSSLGKKLIFYTSSIVGLGGGGKRRLESIWEFIERDPRMMPVLVVRDSTARDALNKKSTMHGISSIQIAESLKNNISYEESSQTKTFIFCELLLQQLRTCIVLGIVELGNSD